MCENWGTAFAKNYVCITGLLDPVSGKPRKACWEEAGLRPSKGQGGLGPHPSRFLLRGFCDPGRRTGPAADSIKTAALVIAEVCGSQGHKINVSAFPAPASCSLSSSPPGFFMRCSAEDQTPRRQRRHGQCEPCFGDTEGTSPGGTEVKGL